ncbi:hypothetical protein KRR23_05985 [Pseudomonas sp. CVAP|uniref:hypothetical protein n=1 Tax=Pseudomonas sp. CVAP\|nr:hypothetical protein [Pseudomonas sp. CVAP\
MTAKEKAPPNLHQPFPGSVEPHPAPVIDGLIENGLLPKVLLDQSDVVVKLVALNEYHAGDTAELHLIDPRKPFPSIVYVGPQQDLPATAAGYPQYFALPSAELLDNDVANASTHYRVKLIVTSGDTGNDIPSKELDNWIDRNAPYQSKYNGGYIRPVRPAFLNVPPDQVIDERWLEDNSHLELEVDTGYPFYLMSDFIRVSISDTVPGADSPLPNEVFSGYLNYSGLVNIPVETFKGYLGADRPLYVAYSITDSVGNASKVSLHTYLDVKRRPEPVLQAPTLPVLGLDGVLDLEKVQPTPRCYVPRPEHSLPTDRILLYLDDVAVAEQAVGEGPGPLVFALSYLVIRQLPIDHETLYEAHLSYQFKRDSELPRQSPTLTFDIDFMEAGPKSPNLPDLINPQMVNVELRGASGTLNHITSEDHGKPVTIRTPMKNPGDPWVVLGNETVGLWFAGNLIYTLPLTGTEIELTYEMPWLVIEQAGPGNHNAFWTIQWGGSKNVFRSERTVVTVDAAAAVEFSPPSAPTYTIIDNGVSKEIINCRSLTGTGADLQLTVTVPVDVTYMPKGSVVEVHSVGTYDRLGFEIIEGTQFFGTYTITGSEAGKVFTLNIQPYSTKIKPIQPPLESGMLNGVIKIWYVVRVNGQPVSSEMFVREVRLLSGGMYCNEV